MKNRREQNEKETDFGCPTVIEFRDGTFIIYKESNGEHVYVDYELLKAINKQYEELGWIDGTD